MPYIFLLLIFVIIILEVSHFLNKTNTLKVKPQNIELIKDDNRLQIKGSIRIENPYKNIELMIPELDIHPLLLGKYNKSDITIDVDIRPNHKELDINSDYYWQAFIVKSKCYTEASFKIDIKAINGNNFPIAIETCWLEINWVDYGPTGRNCNKAGFSLPIQGSNTKPSDQSQFISLENCKILPIKTHILGSLDDPIEMIKNYTNNITKSGDQIVIGETPLAIMEGRYMHPSNIRPSILSKILCRFFHPTSSLATSCGMQTLINEVGPSRVLMAWIIGAVFKVIKIKGVFYRLSGKQARLIDDVTGTTRPYDQTIVLGPKDPLSFCKQASIELGLNVSVVDVNDLGRVKVLATSDITQIPLLKKALKSNPAGNGDEKTPLLILRAL